MAQNMTDAKIDRLNKLEMENNKEFEKITKLKQEMVKA
jgi:hypothetical protein